MNTGRQILQAACAGAMAIGLLAACGGESPSSLRSVTVSGSASLPEGTIPPGTLHVTAYQAWTGEGELRHPLLPLGEFTSNTGEFSGVIEYPADAGEGLVVYGWLDMDGDGVLCTPGNTAEPSGLAVVEPFPVDEVVARLTLDAPCKAANWFFPPAR